MDPILVVGGTRGTGLLIAKLLQARGRAVRVLARDPVRVRARYAGDVAVIPGDITKPDTLPAAVSGVCHIVFTAGCRSGHPARETQIMATEFAGVIHTMVSARQTGFAGRFLYMTASGGYRSSWASRALNLWKGNTLVWRRRVEDEIRKSGLEYTIIRTGVLLNRPGGRHLVRVTQEPLPLSLRYRIARADVAELFVAALDHPRAANTSFEAVWAGRGRPAPWSGLLDGLLPNR